MRLILAIALILAIIAMISTAPMLIDEPGYIAISTGNMIYELTIYTAIFWLTALFLTFLLVIVLLRLCFRVGSKSWKKIAFANRRRALKDFNKGIAAYVLEDYQQAEHLLAKSAEPAQAEQTAYLLAASAADKQALTPNTQHYLALLKSHHDNNPAVGLDAAIVNIQLSINQKDYPAARALLDQYHKHLGHNDRLLSLEVDLSLIELRFDNAINHLTTLRKKKSQPAARIKAWEKQAYLGMFNQIINQEDDQALHNYWQKLPRKIRHNNIVVIEYCRILTAYNQLEALDKILLPLLKKDLGHEAMQALKSLPLKYNVHNIEQIMATVKKHLNKDNDNAKWLSYLAHLAYSSEQWLVAEQAFFRLFNLHDDPYDDHDLDCYAMVLAKQEKYKEANVLLRQRLAISPPG